MEIEKTMKIRRRVFIASLTSITLIGLRYNQAAVSSEKGWFGELSSTINGAIKFVDDVRASLKLQGTEIDRQKMKPSVSEFNAAVSTLLAGLTSLRRLVNQSNSSGSDIAAKASALTPRANRLVQSMEALFIRMSAFDTALEKHKSTIYQLVATRAETIERIRTVTIRPNGGRIDRKLLGAELDNATKISNLLLQSIQSLIKELG